MSVCTICARPTDTACSDCRIDLATSVYVCNEKYCLDIHEKNCPSVLKKQNLSKPKCPKCGSAEVYLYTTECIVRCPNCREVYPTLHLSDLAQFFTGGQ